MAGEIHMSTKCHTSNRRCKRFSAELQTCNSSKRLSSAAVGTGGRRDVRCPRRARRRVVVLGSIVVLVVVVLQVADALVDRAVEAEPALLEDQHPVAHLAHRAGGVADVEQGAALVADLLHPRQALLLERPVPDREHLVDQEDVGVGVHRDREAEPGEHARRSSAPPGCRGTCPMSANSTIWSNLRFGLRLGHAEDRGVEEDVLPAGQLRVEAGAGRDQAGDPAPGQHLAGVGPHHAVDQLEQRALARAVEAHQPDRLALLDGERDVVDAPGRCR